MLSILWLLLQGRLLYQLLFFQLVFNGGGAQVVSRGQTHRFTHICIAKITIAAIWKHFSVSCQMKMLPHFVYLKNKPKWLRLRKNRKEPILWSGLYIFHCCNDHYDEEKGLMIFERPIHAYLKAIRATI